MAHTGWESALASRECNVARGMSALADGSVNRAFPTNAHTAHLSRPRVVRSLAARMTTNRLLRPDMRRQTQGVSADVCLVGKIDTLADHSIETFSAVTTGGLQVFPQAIFRVYRMDSRRGH